MVTLAVILTALWASFRRRTAAVKGSAPLPQNVNRRLSGYTFTRSEEGRQIFTIHASRTLAYDGGVSTVLEGVHVIIFGRQGNRHDEIQTEQCTYYNSYGALACHGEASVKLESEAQAQVSASQQARQPFLLKTSDISYDPRRAMVSTGASTSVPLQVPPSACNMTLARVHSNYSRMCGYAFHLRPMENHPFRSASVASTTRGPRNGSRCKPRLNAFRARAA